MLHGGDLADTGASPIAIIDQIRDLGWRGVAGNTDEMLFRPDSLTAFSSASPQLKLLFQKVAEMAAWTRDELGAERLAWLSTLPIIEGDEMLTLLHASPDDLWRAPRTDADDMTLQSTYRALGRPLVVYAHIHLPYIRHLSDVTIANSGSVGQPHDGDRRSSYLLVDDGQPSVRRVEYDVETELSLLRDSALPYAEWVARSIVNARPEMP